MGSIMILGYLLPNDDIYTLKGEYKGKFKLDDSEEIILKEKNIRINQARYGWGKYLSPDDEIEKGIGEVIKTNMRLIFKKDIVSSINNRILNIPSIQKMKNTKGLKENEIKEYIEIYFDEIVGFDEYKIPLFSGLELLVNSYDNLKYSITFNERYKIIDDPLILKKELTRMEYEK
jgi:hypothetical protein